MPKKQDVLQEAEKIEEEIQELEEVENFQTEEEEAAFSGDDEIFPGGPTYDSLEEWKSRYDGEIFMCDFDNEVFIWRPIRRNEFRDIQRLEGNKDEYYVEEAICRKCVLWPEDYAMHKITFGKAGIPSQLANLIYERSGFLRPATIKL